ncbi:MAG: BlaI/MecI/CopY family transcriptional regulator [Oscillospiraceae bacterium]|nr:BlaI/MecI/CopY family transcriptional regulator [Oscillospiraceae bacterium]
MKAQLFDSELKVMDILWRVGDTTAKELARMLGEQVGWSKTTTYTVIKKCVDKGVIERRGTDFLCHARISKNEVREQEAKKFVDKMFDGSTDLLVASLINSNKMSPEQLQNLRKLLEGLE